MDKERLFKSSEEILKTRGPIIEVQRGSQQFVSIFGIEIEKRSGDLGTIYREEEFADFSLDEKSLELLRIMVIALRNNQPLLLEGETDIGKTKTLELLSFLTNTRLLRISISGQTDTSEFIGKFVPRTSPGEAPWVWQDGIAPQAMRWNNGEGCWLYLDELGAAEPFILVKLNRLLEKTARLELTERGGEIVNAGPNFRIIATTNPPEYAGRQPFAPDFLRRFWYRSVGGLDEQTLRKRLIHIFRDETKSELIATLLGEFHFKANLLISQERIGRDQRQRFRFEFSDLVRIKEHIAESREENLPILVKEAVDLYYVGKVKDEQERKTIRNVFDILFSAHGIEDVFKDVKRQPPKLFAEKRLLTEGPFFKKVVAKDGSYSWEQVKDAPPSTKGLFVRQYTRDGRYYYVEIR